MSRRRATDLTIREQIGQTLVLGFHGTTITPDVIRSVRELGCGGVRVAPGKRFHGDYVDPESGNVVVRTDQADYRFVPEIQPPVLSAEQYAGRLAELQRLATNGSATNVPLTFHYDQEGDGPKADVQFDGVTLFPNQMGIASTGRLELARAAARVSGRQARAAGLSFLHSPVLDLTTRPENPEIYTRSFSADPGEASEWAHEYCHGYREAGVIAAGKHFPGRGDSIEDAHFHLPVIEASRNTMWNRELLPYRRLIAAGLLPAIMTSHSVYTAFDANEVATLSRPILTGLLREKLGFDGVVITDSMTMAAVAKKYGVAEGCARALAAGSDMILMKIQNHLVDEVVTEVTRWVESGRIDAGELEAKVERILALKDAYGLLRIDGRRADAENPDSHRPSATSIAVKTTVSSGEVHRVASEIASASTRVLRSGSPELPVQADERVLLVEQAYAGGNNATHHSAMLFERLSRAHHGLMFYETGIAVTSEDEKQVLEISTNVDRIVVSNFHCRGYRSNLPFLTRLVSAMPDKVTIVTNTPFSLTIPQGAGSVVLCYGYTPECLDECLSLLLGGTDEDHER